MFGSLRDKYFEKLLFFDNKIRSTITAKVSLNIFLQYAAIISLVSGI